MFAQFRYLDGASADRVRVSASDFATIGRHPGSDVPFDPEQDLLVSVRHAAVFKQGGSFMVRDLGSTNGTFVNGSRVQGDRPLEPGDVIQLGPNGPRIEFAFTDRIPAGAGGAAPRPDPKSRIRPPRTPTAEHLAVRVRRQTSRWRWIIGGTAAVAGLLLSQMALQARRERARLETQRSTLLSRVDDLLSRIERTRSEATGVERALVAARAEVVSLRAAIAQGRATSDRLDTLTRRVAAESRHQREVMSAARFDPGTAAGRSRRAVVVVVAQLPDGRVRSGTGVAVRADGDVVLVVTARQVIQDSAGVAASQLAVIFDGATQAFRATLTRRHERADLASLAVRTRAAAVAGLAEAVRVGAPVGLVGYPGGVDSLGPWRTRGVHATATVGTVTAAGPDLLTIDGYGARSAAGSPVFDAGGALIGVVGGGRPGAAPGPVYAVPAGLVAELLKP